MIKIIASLSSFESVITPILFVGALISGIWLLVLKRNKKTNNEQETAYQEKLAKEYRDEWLKIQEESKEESSQ